MMVHKLNKHRAILTCLLIVFILLQLPGCVYLRLLELKNQFKEFDQYIEIRTDQSFSLFFKQPELRKEDIHDLSKLNPTQIISSNDGEEWIYRFVKIDHQNESEKPQPVTLVFRFKFDRHGKLEQWYFPDEFLAIVPPEFLEASLRSLGNATIFKLSRKLKADVAQIKTRAKPPSQATVKQVLGQPDQIVDKEKLQRYLYRFRLITDWVEDGYEERKIALVKLDFVAENRLLIRASPRFAGLKISIDYSKLLGENYFSATN
ncbi:MAG: hypothetical protein V3V22_08805 [Methylococcales bacterium]